MIIECKISCHKTALTEMGINNSEWMDFSFNLKRVVAIKVTDDEEIQAEDVAVIYLENQDGGFVTDIPYKELLDRWKNLIRCK